MKSFCSLLFVSALCCLSSAFIFIPAYPRYHIWRLGVNSVEQGSNLDASHGVPKAKAKQLHIHLSDNIYVIKEEFCIEPAEDFKAKFILSNGKKTPLTEISGNTGHSTLPKSTLLQKFERIDITEKPINKTKVKSNKEDTKAKLVTEKDTVEKLLNIINQSKKIDNIAKYTNEDNHETTTNIMRLNKEFVDPDLSKRSGDNDPSNRKSQRSPITESYLQKTREIKPATSWFDWTLESSTHPQSTIIQDNKSKTKNISKSPIMSKLTTLKPPKTTPYGRSNPSKFTGKSLKKNTNRPSSIQIYPTESTPLFQDVLSNFKTSSTSYVNPIFDDDEYDD